MRAAVSVLVLSLAVACTETHAVPEPDGSFVRLDGGTPRDARVPPRDGSELPPKCATPAPVDVLFVIDNSGSMAEEQASLAAELPAFVTALLEPPDRDGDGEPDWLPVPDLHLGVVTMDMGSGGHAVPTCTEPDFGDDGLLRTQGSSMVGCMATYPPFLSARPGETDPATVAADLACVANMGLGEDGCGFEQHLEAALKAVTPSTSPIRFFRGTTGHGDGVNDGFLREGSHLAIVVLADEDDCSAADPDLYALDSTVYDSNLNLRCARHPEALHPVERYVDGLLGLRAGRPHLLSYAVIAGVPVDLVEEGASYEEILADERMQHVVEDGSRLRPACNVPGRGLAFPARRLVATALGLEGAGAVTAVRSVCQGDFSAAVRVVSERIGRNACQAFLE